MNDDSQLTQEQLELIQAISQGRFNDFQEILNRNPTMDLHFTHDGRTPLATAGMTNNLGMVTRLLGFTNWTIPEINAARIQIRAMAGEEELDLDEFQPVIGALTPTAAATFTTACAS
jgi:hypothetical protein